LEDAAAKLSPEFHSHIVGGVTTRFPADGRQDLAGVNAKPESVDGPVI
jgi:hypothetical protein